MSVTPVARPSRDDTLNGLHARDLLSIRDLSGEELTFLLHLANEIKHMPERFAHALAGKTLALLFEKPSLRTRVSFDVAMTQLGGHAIYLGPNEVGLGKRESIHDVARTLGGMVQGVMARTFAHSTLERLADASPVPVINGLSDFSHPCQALADFQTILELKGRFDDLTLAYVGDGNNVANSLIFAATLLGVTMRVASPAGFEPSTPVLAWAREHEREPGLGCRVMQDPEAAVRDADIVYTDTWISMGQEDDAERRRGAFAGFEITTGLMRDAKPNAIFMHCLPAHRGEEVEAAVIDSPQSVVFHQAQNRLHAEKAVLYSLLG